MVGTAFSAANWSGYDSASFTSASDLTDWSPPIVIANLSAGFKSAVQSDGADIRITKSDGTTELPYALIGWSYNAGSPTGLIRVKFSGSSGTTANTIRIYAGYTPGTATAYDANETYGSDNAFASHWKGYWADGGGADWTSNDNDGSAQGGVTFGGATGKVGPGTDYNGTDQYSLIADDSALQVQSGCIMAWAASSQTNSWEGLFSRFSLTVGGFAAMRRGTSDDMSVRQTDGSTNNTGTLIEARGGTLSTSLKHYRCEFSLTDVEVFENDSSVGTDSDTIPAYTDPGIAAQIGLSQDLDGYWDGIICEVQLHSPAVSDAWADEEYSATNDNASYWTTWSWTSAGDTSPTLSTAVIPSAGTTLVLTYDENVTATDESGFTLNSDGAAVTLSGLSGDGTDTHIYTLSRTVDTDETLDLDYDSGTGSAVDDTDNALATFSGASVTNNSTQDVTPPTLSSAVIPSAGTTLILTFDENVTATDESGFNLDSDGDAVTLSGLSGDGTATLTYTLSRTVLTSETLNLDYSSGTGSVVDDSSNALASFTDTAVTNNSTQTGTAPTVSSATVNTAGDTLTIVFSESVTGQSGWSMRASYAYVGITAASGDGTDTHTFTLSREALQGERLWIIYDPDSGNATGDIEVEEIGWREQTVTNNSTYTITRPSLPTYLGDKKITGLTTITPVITCNRTSGAEPMYIQVSAEQTTADAGSHPFFDLHFEWDFGDPSGTEELTNYFTGSTINMNDGQRGPEAAYVYRSPGNYTITLTAKGINEYGQTVSASTTSIIRLGEWEYFDGNGSAGTFTLTCEVDSDGGETTASIDYDATTAEIVTALEALSNVPSGTMRDTGYGTIEAVGSLAGADVSLTLNSSITGAGSGDGAPAMVERWSPETETDITVSSTSGWTQIYFDSEAAGGGDGSSGSPYNSATELREQFHSSFHGDRSNVVCNIAAGSDFTLPNSWKFSEQNTGWRFKKWGSGADPIIRDSVSASSTQSLLYAEFPYAPSVSELLLSDIVFSNIDFRCNTSGDSGALRFAPTQNGNSANPHVWFAFGLIDNCSFTREAGENQMVRINDEDYAQSFMLWNSHLNAGPFPTLASYGCNVSQWGGACGGSFAGVDAEGSLLDHHVYPKLFGHSLWSCIGFEDGFNGTNTCLNLTAAGYDYQVSKWHLMFGCNITGTMNGMDLANEYSDYDDGVYTRLGDVLILACLIHSGRIDSQENGIIAPNIQSLCVRYCDLWDNLDKGIVTSDLTYLEDYRVEFVNSYADGPGIFIRTDNAKLFGNKIYSTDATNAAQNWYSNDCDITTADADYNTYYAPNSTSPLKDRDGTFVSFATWQGYGHDANGSVADPGFSDPDHGVMNYTYASPDYESPTDETAPTVSSASINTAGSTYTIVYDESVTGQSGHSLTASGGAVTLTPSSGDGTDTHVFSLSRTIVKTETVTRSYTPGDAVDDSDNALVAYSDQSVTNGSGMPRPSLLSASINSAGDEISLSLSENVTGQTGWTLTATDGAVTATGDSGDGTDSHVLSLSRTIGSHETVTIAYVSASGNAVDDDGLEIADFSGGSVTNGSTQDTVKPTLLWAKISVADQTITYKFSEAVTGQTAFTLTASGGAVTLSSPSGDGTDTHVHSLSRAVADTETVTTDYDSGTGTSADASGNTLDSISGRAVSVIAASTVSGVARVVGYDVAGNVAFDVSVPPWV